jgi:hypothetical protein
MARSEVFTPTECSLHDIGVDLFRHDLVRYGDWAVRAALFKTTQHNVHGTTRDSRPFSYIRKLPIPFKGNSGLPQEYIDITQTIYNHAMPLFAEYLGVDLSELPTRYAAEAHVRRFGDGPGEGHVDYLPSFNTYFSDNDGGALRISRNPNAQTIDEIAADAFSILPRMGKVGFFNGEFLPHYVEEPTSGVPRINAVLAYHYDKPDADPRHPRHYTA